MTSTNINKFVKSNINLKPWMLSKNTSQIVNNYIQKIYKQMPASFNKDIKTVKVASPRTENMGPLRFFKNQERQIPLAAITPRAGPMKKSTTKLKQTDNNLLNSLKVSNKNNQQMASKLAGANLSSSKRLLKSPNYKIYKSRRFGSSASSSRSSIFRRHDDRRRQKQTYPSQINYLIRSFHTGQFEPTYARYLMPARNQQVEANLGSIPDAIRFSSDIQNDLMKIDNFTRSKMMGNKKSNLKMTERNRFDVWNHPPSLSKFKIQSPKDSAIKNVSLAAERNMRRSKLSPEHRDYARINVLRTTQLKHPKPPNELFTAQHDRNKTELHEKHRRNRMMKLGLIESPTAPETETEDGGDEAKVAKKQREKRKESSETSVAARRQSNQISKIETTSSLNQKSNLNLKSNPSKDKKPSSPKKENASSTTAVSLTSNTPLNTLLPSKDVSSTSSVSLSQVHSLISPIAAARAQMPNRNSYRNYRYNRNDFFSTKKY